GGAVPPPGPLTRAAEPVRRRRPPLLGRLHGGREHGYGGAAGWLEPGRRWGHRTRRATQYERVVPVGGGRRNPRPFGRAARPARQRNEESLGGGEVVQLQRGCGAGARVGPQGGERTPAHRDAEAVTPPAAGHHAGPAPPCAR